MTSDPDLVLKSHESVARDPHQLVEDGAGAGWSPHYTWTHTRTQPRSHTHCASPASSD